MLGFLLLSMVYFTSGMQYTCYQKALYQFVGLQLPQKYPVSPVSPERPSRSLRGHARFLTVVNSVFHVENAVYMLPESSLPILGSPASLEVPRLLGVSRASSKESKRTCLVPDCSQWCISRQECSIHVARKFCTNFDVSSFLRSTPSPRCLQTFLQGV